MEKRKIHFIINPISGVKKKVKVVDSLKTYLDPNFGYGIDFTEYAAHATELTSKAIERGVDAIIAVGGDGTINEVARAMIGSEVPLGVIPMGSGNGFARHMEIPLKLQHAIECINRFETQLIDTGVVNGEPFVATVGMGFDALVGRRFADFGKRGLLSYMQVSTHEFFSFSSEDYDLLVDGSEVKIKAFLINIANVGQYGNNAWIAPDASVTDGQLNVCILEPFPQHMIGEIIFRLFNKSLDKSKYYHSYPAKEVKVLNPSLYHMDGEPREKSALEIKVVPKSLRVIC
jgi:YegS/Rv2252/BmrU family lipid kinase